MGKKPYSAKAKREQLRQKRLASTSTPSTTTAPSQAVHPAVPASNTSTPAVAASAANRRPRSRAPKRSAAQRYRLQLGDADSTCSEQRSLAHETLNTLPSYEVSVSDIRPYPDVRFTMPRRPSWRYDDSLATLDKRENAALNSWIKQVDSPDTHSAFFEHNLETWRQLWRVIERSDVIVIVADVRFPALHFIPDLYHYVSDELGKGLVLALNKCDLVPAHLLNAWTRYFRDTYPDLAIAKFSSFPDAKLAPSEDNSELLSKRERRMARSKLSAWGADQLLAAIDSLDLDPKKRAFLEEWRVQVDAEASSDDEQTSLGTKFYDDQGSYDPQSRRNTTPLAPGDEILMQKQKKKRRRAKAKFLGREPRLDSESGKEETDFHDVGSQTSNVKLELEDDETRENMLTIGVVGHPNAGKSSLINGIFGKKVMSTSRTPGHTKHLQTMFLTDSLRLCDCPGLVFPGLVPRELQILAGMFPISQVREPYAAVKYLAERVPLVELLNLESEVARLEEFTEENGYIRSGWTAWKICEAWAMKRGFRTAKAARLDVFRAANSILRLALDGRIVLATVPRGYSRRDSDGQCFGDSVINVSKKGGEVASAMKWTDGRGKFEKGRADAECSEEQSEDSERDDRIESSEESEDDIGGQPKLGNAFYLLADE